MEEVSIFTVIFYCIGIILSVITLSIIKNFLFKTNKINKTIDDEIDGFLTISIFSWFTLICIIYFYWDILIKIFINKYK